MDLRRVECALIAFLVAGGSVFAVAQFGWRWCYYLTGPGFGIGAGLLLAEIVVQRRRDV